MLVLSASVWCFSSCDLVIATHQNSRYTRWIITVLLIFVVAGCKVAPENRGLRPVLYMMLYLLCQIFPDSMYHCWAAALWVCLWWSIWAFLAQSVGLYL
jgi:hypothetical protein